MLKQFASLGFLLSFTLLGSSLGSSQVSSSHISKVRERRLPGFQVPPALIAVGGTHTVRSGETLWGIARRYGVSFTELVRLNGLSATNPIIRIGSRLKLPNGSSRANGAATGGFANHVVRHGETLSQIARRYGSSAKALQTANNMANPNSLRVGQTLQIPLNGRQPRAPAVPPKRQAPPKAAPEPRKLPPAQSIAAPPDRSGKVPLGFALYQTESGDTMASIAKKYRISKAELLRINRRSSSPGYTPRLGELIMVPTDGSWYVPKSQKGTVSAARPSTQGRTKQGTRLKPPASTSLLIEHIVAPNDTLEALSRRFGTTVDQIRLDNRGIRGNRDLRVGSALKIRVNRSL